MSECDPTEDEDGVTVCAAHAWLMAGIAPGGLCIEGRLIEAEAAIARVRGMAEAALAAHDELEGTYATVSAKAILNALEGGSDERRTQATLDR